ncbi:MAG: single-stranded DNA-binding protein [Gemmatimonadetes bacterium]|nr:single-stranded DNA-binding protein [Gemmatimonadota bacterium]MYB05278.1 single-stranded DNA-binding protein [Gemmatimonadota bacterium]MYE16346.1 single-stranded DNA-binding protein [Gemmatimonadota bacterium]MYG22091.1 single-stranded DNA-binding protein [Gemmatimonadota bacterium]MYJ38248.1 single-stranded DNA-binding protein [Gemmatimonadota bacterium]
MGTGHQSTRQGKDAHVSRSVNKIILVGNVGSDPDVRVTSAGVKVARVSLATNWRTTGEDSEERTDWHRVNLWGRLAQVAEEYVSKGDKLYVEGYLQYDSYERDGVTIPTAEIRAREMVMLSPRGAEV